MSTSTSIRFPSWTRPLEEACRQTLELGTPLVKPHAQHMYTYLTALVLCDEADEQALRALTKKRHRREFKLSLHGWMEFRIAAVDLSTGEITTNRAGKPFGKDLKRWWNVSLQTIRRGETQ